MKNETKYFSYRDRADVFAHTGLFARGRVSGVFSSGSNLEDTVGKPINARGGGILFHGGVYYWYGEFKEVRTYLAKVNKTWGGTRVIAGGVSCYSSTNLFDWKNEGLVPPSVADDSDHDLECENVHERPKVIHNARTKNS